MGLALKNIYGETLRNKRVIGYKTEDAIRAWGSGNTLDGNVIQDTSGSAAAHRDLVQLIPKGLEPNSQMHGQLSKGNVITNNSLTSNGLAQCIFESDGGELDIVISDNICDTRGAHFITGCFISGSIHDNTALGGKPCPVNNNPLRIGGGHPKSFYVTSFLPSSGLTYKEIDTNQPIIDNRQNKVRHTATYMDDFDLKRWRQLCEKIPYPHGGFNEHFEACLREYVHGELGVDTEYSTESMWIEEGTLHVPDRRKLTQYDLNYWHSVFPYFAPYEVDSRDFSILLNVEAFLLLNKLRHVYGKPLRVNSAWRTPKHNRNVGGKRNSDHTFIEHRELNGSAYDLHVDSPKMGKQLEELAVKLGFNAVGRYRSSHFIHISKRKPKPNGAIYQWGRW